MARLVSELPEAIRKEGLVIPANPHLYRQLLRAGNLDVGGAVVVLRKFLQMIGGSHKHYFEHVLPFDRTEPVWRQRLLSTPPVRDQHGRRILLMRTGVWNPEKVDFQQITSLTYQVLSVVALEPKTQIPASPSSSTAPDSATNSSKTSASTTSRSSPYSLSKGFPCGSARFTSAERRGSSKCFSPF